MKKLLIFFISVSILFNSCSTDVDINADWKDVTIVYGILNLNDSINYIKINKAFLGDANAYEMAKQSDSLFYNSINKVSLQQGKTNANGDWVPYGPEILLQKTDSFPKDTGIFASNRNDIFYTTEKLLKDDNYNEYKLAIDIPGKDLITSTTRVFNTLIVTQPTTWGSRKVNFASTVPYTVKWNSTKDARLYELTVRFWYYEIIGTDTSLKHIDWPQQRITSSKLDQEVEMTLDIDGPSFFKYVQSQLSPLENGKRLSRRKKAIDFLFLIGGDDLNTYIQVSSPSNTIVQEKPSYTNIKGENNLGIFSCRYDMSIKNQEADQRMIDSLALGIYTKNLNFLSFNQAIAFYSNTDE